VTEQAPEELECVEVVITAESAEWLADFTRQLVEDRLVACGHNIAPIRAIYRWEGKVYDETQARVGLHTRASLVPAIVARADRNHPDNVPCVIALPLLAVTKHISNGSTSRRTLRVVPAEEPQSARNPDPPYWRPDSRRFTARRCPPRRAVWPRCREQSRGPGCPACRAPSPSRRGAYR
jgi:periplasmic divalent cation tolerance protein